MNHLTNNKHNLKHGFKGHKLYGVWEGMCRRCYEWTNENYKYYGEIGIRVCDEWVDDVGAFCNWALANGWAEGLHIDRIDNEGDYSPKNCRFVTCAENNKNKRLIQCNNSTGYRGVTRNNGRGKPYKAQVKASGKTINLGHHQTKIEAATARDEYVIKNNLGLPLNFMANSLPGRQLADALENWLDDSDMNLHEYHLWIKSATVIKRGNDTPHQWRLDRIKWCYDQLAKE